MGFQTLFSFALGITAAFALLTGGKPEKLCAIAFVTAALWTEAIHGPSSHRYATTEVGVLVVDAALLLILIAIALRFDRFWPLWMVALQAMGVAAHLSRLAGMPLVPLAYQRALVFWSYPMVPLLAIATWRYRRRALRQRTLRLEPLSSASYSARLASWMGTRARRR